MLVRITRAVAFSLALVSLATAAAGHGTRLPLAEWGPFAPPLLDCHRHLHRAAVRCARLSWLAQQRCLAQKLAGATCNPATTNADVAAARRQALDTLDLACSERQLQDLGFLGSFDAQADLIDACRTLPNAAASIAYGLVPPDSLTDAGKACVAVAGPAIGDLLLSALDTWNTTLDRIAKTGGSLESRQERLERGEMRVTHVAGITERLARSACSAEVFRATYGREIAGLLTDLAGLSACPTARTCVQDQLLCPDPVCGNAIREAGEDCDDGNVDDGDGCPATCIATAA